MAETLGIKKTLEVNGKSYSYYSIAEAGKKLKTDFARLPFSLKVLLENLLRWEDGRTVKKEDIQALAEWLANKSSSHEIAYRPARVLMQDFTGVPAVVDLAAMRDAVKHLGGDVKKINPLTPVDLVIDHSVMVDKYGTATSFKENVAIEYERNRERYEFLRWGQEAFDNFRVVPPGTGICHQVNLEYLGRVVWTKEEKGETIAYPDTCVGTDSHTTMINGLAILGWGVGGIEAEAAMLGQPISMLIPEVIGFKLTGKLKEGTTATDLVLTVTQMLRKKGVVGKFVEFFGPGLHELPLADRATIANMAPEYGATCGFFPVDEQTLQYMRLTGREDEQIELVREYAKAQSMWHDKNSKDPVFTDTLELDISTVESCIAGPKRPQDKIQLSAAAKQFVKDFEKELSDSGNTKGKYVPAPGEDFEPAKDELANTLPGIDSRGADHKEHAHVRGKSYDLSHGDVVIAAITSCTNTSNPNVLIGAGLIARKALAKGMQVKPWVKTSLAPGSQVVTEYLEKSKLQKDLDGLGFNLVGYGCTTCIGNSGPLNPEIEKCIKDNDLVVASVLSGNRNFEGRVNPLTKANYLASPMLVVIYALAGNMHIDVAKDPIGKDKNGKPVFMKDIWPTNKEIQDIVSSIITPKMFKEKYGNVFKGDEHWQKINVTKSETYKWDSKSTYIQNPPYFEGWKPGRADLEDINGAKVLALLGDSITTDHISPAGSISADSPAAKYLQAHKVEKKDFNSYGSRRGNHEVMMRGTFANIRIRNEMTPEKEGGWTKYLPDDEVMSIYDASMKYQSDDTPLVVIAGKDYGMGSSRDWAAKGTRLLGVKAVIAESYERIHRSNLVGMGVLPLQFPEGVNRKTLKLDGTEEISITGIAGKGITPRMEVDCAIKRKNGEHVKLLCRVDTLDEVEYMENGGILHNVIKNLIAA